MFSNLSFFIDAFDILGLAWSDVWSCFENLFKCGFVNSGFVATRHEPLTKWGKSDHSLIAIDEGVEVGYLDESIEAVGRTIPTCGLGTPEEVGELGAFLASDESSYLTGTRIVISGGRHTTRDLPRTLHSPAS